MNIYENTRPLLSPNFYLAPVNSDPSNRAEQQAKDELQLVADRKKETLHFSTGTHFDHQEISPLPKGLLLFHAIILQLFAIGWLMTFASFASADAAVITQQPHPQWPQLASLIEEEKRSPISFENKKIKTSWALALDNDVLALGDRDRDYTFGINLTYSGTYASNAVVSLKTPLAVIDDWFGLEQVTENFYNNYSVETGIYGFTPEDITQQQINNRDRPYASIFYLSSSHDRIDSDNNIAWKTTLTIGALGLDVAGKLQSAAHELISAKEARGWNHQISDGGELTGRYVIARQHYLEGFSKSLEVKSTLQASVGYLTEASWSLSFRGGKIISPWATFNPDLTTYGEKSTYSNNAASFNEYYFWAGFTLKARVYNAFLQGQVRDTDWSYAHQSLRPIIMEAWAGYTYAFKEGYRISYVLRAQTSEIKSGDGNRSIVWGGLIFAKTI
ncbi:MAG: lipid A deacylase LpxR family protein [Pseudomonadota bacterium]